MVVIIDVQVKYQKQEQRIRDLESKIASLQPDRPMHQTKVRTLYPGVHTPVPAFIAKTVSASMNPSFHRRFLIWRTWTTVYDRGLCLSLVLLILCRSKFRSQRLTTTRTQRV